jgi:simple sugar transport system ATP-binding protein
MVAQGLSVIFISHKLAEVLRVADRVVVLRGGRVVAEAQAAATSAAELARWMVGQDVVLPQGRPSAVRERPVVAALEHVQAGDGRERLRDLSLQLRGGEITAIAGVSGNGQLALAELLCGMRPRAPAA